MVIVPKDTPGVEIVRNPTILNMHDPEGHAEILFRDVRVPVSHLLGEEGSGFALAQARLGPGRIHHCMRAIGQAEKALELMCRRAMSLSVLASCTALRDGGGPEVDHTPSRFLSFCHPSFLATSFCAQRYLVDSDGLC